MPNWMSDEDLAMESGDLRTCEHCGVAYWVDQSHSCDEGQEASRQSNEAFDREYFGGGQMVTRKITVEVTCPDTDAAFSIALQDFSSWYKRGDSAQHSDPVLQFSWKAEEAPGHPINTIRGKH